MLNSRRDFIKNTAFVVAGASFLPDLALNSMKKKIYTGIQLYSVRDDMKKDPLGTLKQLSAMGYKYVEHANYVDRKFYGYSAKEFKKVLRDLGMKMYTGHTVLRKDHWDESKKQLTDAWKWTVEDAATVGQKYVISPWMDESYRKTYDDFMHCMDIFNKSGQLCRQSGMKFGYHNHHFEFDSQLNNTRIYDIMMKNTDPAMVTQQLDTGNLYNGGGVALDVVKQYPGRFELMHVKDEIEAKSGDEKYESTILGEGIVHVKEVIDIVRNGGGAQHFIIEQEAYQNKTPLDCAKENFKIMKQWGY